MRLFAFLVVTAALLFSACGETFQDGADGSVISVEDRTIFPEDIEQAFERYRGDTLSVDIFKDNIIARELFIASALDLGIGDDREVLRLTHERSREILQSEWMSYQLGFVELDPQEVIDFWSTMGTGVSYTSFYHEDSLLMDSVCTMVKAGESLSRFARELGFDEMVRLSEGRITLNDRNYSNVIDFDFLSTASTGDVCDPFPVPLGWRMLQVDSMWTYDSPPFAADSSRIASMLLSREREVRKQFLEDSLKVVYNVQVDMDVLNLMADRADSQGSMFGIFEPEEETMVAVSWDGGSRDLFSVTQNVMGLPSAFPRKTNDVDWLVDYARRLAMFDIEMAEAIELGLDTNPEIAMRLNTKRWEIILDKYYLEVISPRIVMDSSSVETVYMQIRDDYPVLETRVFHALFLSDSDKIEDAENLMASGEDVLELRDQFELFPPILAEGEETITTPIPRAMIPEDSREILFGLVLTEEAIVTLTDSTALWFRLHSINEEHTPELEEIRDRVMAEVKQRNETEAIETLVDSLSLEYHLYVDEEYFECFYVPVEMDSASTAESSLEVN